MPDPAMTGPGPAWRRPKPLLRTTLGEVLRRTRLEQGRTLADVARAARVSMPYLSELERGRKEASSEVLAAICEALRIGLPDLLILAGRDLAGAMRELAVPGSARPGAPRDRADAGGDLPGSARPARVVRLEPRRGRRLPPGHASGEVTSLLAA